MSRIGLDARKLGDGGIGRYVSELLSAYGPLVRNEEIVALVRPHDFGVARGLAPNFEIVPVRSKGYSLGEHLELGWLARRLGLDLLHLPHYVVPLAVQCPVVVTVHDLVHWRFPRSRLHQRYCRFMMGVVRKRARLVLTPASAVARDLEELVGLPAGRIRVVPNGLSRVFAEEAQAPPGEKHAFLRRVGLKQPYLLNVTNGLPHKGLDLLLAAAAGLPGVTLALAGHGSNRPDVLRTVEASGGSPETVVVLGGLSDRELRLAYEAACAVVVPSRLEGFGLPALEGMAVGVPVIASDAGGLPEVVGDAGLLFPSGSVAHLRGELYRVAFELKGEERQRLIQRGRARARQFSWERTARATLAAYQRALGEV